MTTAERVITPAMAAIGCEISKSQHATISFGTETNRVFKLLLNPLYQGLVSA